jgi:prevent-host-death family protein
MPRAPGTPRALTRCASPGLGKVRRRAHTSCFPSSMAIFAKAGAVRRASDNDTPRRPTSASARRWPASRWRGLKVLTGHRASRPIPDNCASTRPKRSLSGLRRRAAAAGAPYPATVGIQLYSAGMTFTCPVPQAGSHLAELVDRARRSHERVVLTEHGQPAAVLISVDDLDELQRFQDDSDIALCEAINARNEPGVPHDQFMASLDVES